jgi:G:T-mismatch repair DNA endonuclease (very short patch repair protein)
MKKAMVDAGLDGFDSEQPFHGFIPDEINHSKKIIVEFFGDFYHCNPKKYSDPKLFMSAIERTVGEQWERDRKRISRFSKHGYTTIIIWENDFKEDPIKQISRIKALYDVASSTS